MVDLPPPSLSLHFPLHPPSGAARRRALRVGIGQGLYITLVVALLFAVNSLDALVGPGALKIWMIAIGLGWFFGYLAFQASRPAPNPVILLGDRGLGLPLRGHERQAFIGYERLGVAYTTATELVLGLRGYFPERFRRGDFEHPGVPEQIVAIIRQQVAGLPIGGALERLDRRAAIDRLLHRGRAPLSWAFAVLLTLMFGLQLYSVRDFGGFDSVMMMVLLGANAPDLVWQGGDYYRLVTSSLLHGGFAHFALNTVGLVVIGRFVEPLLGRWRYLCLLLLSCLGGALASSLPLRADAAVSLGASTGLAGTFAAYALLRQRFRADLPMPPPSRAFWFILALLVLVPALIVPNIDHLGHAGGAAVGVALAALLSRGLPLDRVAAKPAGIWRPLGVALTLLFLVTPAWTLWQQAPILGQVTANEISNEEAWIAAIHPEAPRDVLEAVREKMEDVVAKDPQSHFLDTLATVYHRLGEHDLAVATQRRAIDARSTEEDGAPDPFLYAQLARFELARAGAQGPPDLATLGLQLHLRLGDSTDAGRLELSTTDAAADGAGAMTPVRLHVVLLRGELPIVFVSLEVPAPAMRQGALPSSYELPPGVRQANSGALQVSVTLAEQLAPSDAPQGVSWRALPLDPQAFALP